MDPAHGVDWHDMCLQYGGGINHYDWLQQKSRQDCAVAVTAKMKILTLV